MALADFTLHIIEANLSEAFRSATTRTETRVVGTIPITLINGISLTVTVTATVEITGRDLSSDNIDDAVITGFNIVSDFGGYRVSEIDIPLREFFDAADKNFFTLESRLYSGDDRLLGGPGTQDIEASFGNDLARGKAGGDTMLGGLGDDSLFGGPGHDFMGGDDGNDMMRGGAGNDDIFGGFGADWMLGDRGRDSIFGEQGDDFADGGRGRDLLDGGEGDDTLFGRKGADSLRGGAGNDSLSGNSGKDTLQGGAGNDTIEGGNGDDRLEGDDEGDPAGGADSLEGGRGNDQLLGRAGNDMLVGGSGNDSLNGGTGDDTLNGGPGNNVLIGGEGSDTFLFNYSILKAVEPENNTGAVTVNLVQDFSPTEDVIVFNNDESPGFPFSSFDDLIDESNGFVTVSGDDDGVLISFATATFVVQLPAVGLEDLNPDNVIVVIN